MNVWVKFSLQLGFNKKVMIINEKINVLCLILFLSQIRAKMLLLLHWHLVWHTWARVCPIAQACTWRGCGPARPWPRSSPPRTRTWQFFRRVQVRIHRTSSPASDTVSGSARQTSWRTSRSSPERNRAGTCRSTRTAWSWSTCRRWGTWAKLWIRVWNISFSFFSKVHFPALLLFTDVMM